MNASRLINRRQFLRRSAAMGVAAGVAPYFVPSHVLAGPGRLGANDRIGVGVIGCGRQGGTIMALAGKNKNARIVAIADVNLPRAQKAALPYRATVVQDYRKLLERGDVDAIITATPEQWRALTCLHACQAGKDIYAEKPMTLTIREGALMLQAARYYKRVFQCGSQQRSQVQNNVGCALVRSGAIGKVTKVIGYNYPSPWECALPAQPVPDGLDWDQWCGPAPLVPYNADLYAPRAKPGWLSFRPFSGGEMTGWGAHGLDQVQWGLGMDESGPVEVWTEGDRFRPPTYSASESLDRGNKICGAPRVFYRYASGAVLELREDGPHGGATFIGEKGTITVDRGTCVSDPHELVADAVKNAVREELERAGVHAPPATAPTTAPAKSFLPSPHAMHVQNWLDCIRTRSKPKADVETGHRSATVCHLGNIARWVGRPLKWDPVKEIFPGDAEANAYLDRERRKGYELPVVT